MRHVSIYPNGQKRVLLVQSGTLGLALKQMADTSANAAAAQQAAQDASNYAQQAEQAKNDTITGLNARASKDGSDITSAADWRDALELGDAALKDTGTAAGTLAAGDDSRIVGAAQKSSNLSDLADADAAVANLGLASRVYLSPLIFGAAGDGTSNDTTAWLAVIAAAKSTGLPIDGGNKLYGVNFGFFNGVLPGLGANFTIRNARFKDLNPNQTTGTSRTLQFSGAGASSTDWIALDNVKIDRNGGSSDTALHYNVGVEISHVGWARVRGLEAFGNNAGELIRFEKVGLVTGDVYAHDGFYVHTTQTNDTVEGVVLSEVDTAFLNVKIARIGRTDRTTVQRDRYSRGLTLDRCRNGVINVDISQVDQGVDYSGIGSSRVKTAGHVRHCFTNGVKLAHGHFVDNIANLNIEHCGRWPVLIGGPNDSEGSPYQQMIRVSGLAISEAGSNGYYSGLGSTVAGVCLDRNSADSLRASFPKNVVVEGNTIVSYVGSVVVTRSGGNLVMADGSFPVSTGKPVTFTTTGTLPTGLTPGTTYWLSSDGSLTVRVATSYINALDGVFLTLSGGSGTHTMTGKSFMDYRGYATHGSVKDTAAPNIFRNNLGGGATVADSFGFTSDRPFAVITTNNFVTIPSTTETTVILNGVGKTDADAMYNPSTGVFTIQRAGLYELGFVQSWEDGVAASNVGYRAGGVRVNGAYVGERAWMQASPDASQETVMSRTVQAVLNVGDTVDFRAYQNGGTLRLKAATRLWVTCLQAS
ncbi:hypothetical protein [Brevundimonas pondensis]|uniref:C1q domain-containing protein n=1 Tax=Brevundimonas pondensis TaxID=2774189 RepID=A0ABX7SKA1_9CAUL|nr:hypothetical protein [Brevundimonas pondensis]QTC88117.1 hypothetical protein IFE19_01530 [Brevundimonas pondensis]